LHESCGVVESQYTQWEGEGKNARPSNAALEVGAMIQRGVNRQGGPEKKGKLQVQACTERKGRKQKGLVGRPAGEVRGQRGCAWA